MEFRTPYSPHKAADYGLSCRDDLKAQQHFKDECDINLIFAKYQQTGEPLPEPGGKYDETGEYLAYNDYRRNLEMIIEADNEFMALPARVRKYYDNDPAKYLEAVYSKDASIYDLGIAVKPPVLEPKTGEAVKQPGGEAPLQAQTT